MRMMMMKTMTKDDDRDDGYDDDDENYDDDGDGYIDFEVP